AQGAKNDSLRVSQSSKKEEGNRNVMLNAASANGPREISIGLPGGDVNVLENGLPVVYNSNPHNVNTHWRGDSSLGHVGLLKISETAIATGNIGYAVNSFTQLGESDGFFKGTLNYNTNHFGKQQFDLNLNGDLGNGWYYSGSVYQNFDPGTFKLRFAQYQDRTQIYKAALTKKYNEGRGQLSVIYHYSNSHWLSNATTGAPFIYVGDGSVKEIPGFSLGTSSYLPNVGTIPYMDIRTGEVKVTNLYDATASHGNQLTLLHKYRWDNGLEWKVNMKYDHALGSYLYQTPMDMKKQEASAGYRLKRENGTLEPYSGYVQSRMSCFNRGYIDELLFTTELSRRTATRTWRIGLNEWYYDVDYASNTTMYDHTVEAYPQLLYGTPSAQVHYYGDTPYYNFNQNASEYYKGYENKLALYATHDWDITNRLNSYLGARLEYQRLAGENLAVYNKEGKAVGRFHDYHIGATAADGTTIAPCNFGYDWLNMAFTAALTYKITDRFGMTGDFTYITQRPNLTNFAPAEMPNVDKITVPLGRAGLYYNTDWLSLTSLFSYIAKTNNNSTLNLINPNDPTGKDIKAAPLSYDIQTVGWTTDAVIKPFKGFDFHFLFTYQVPKYKKYETGVTFPDGSEAGINATGNIVAEIPKVLVELDPSYMVTKDLKVWASFRYFSKTYANINDAYYFNGRWETFGGVNWQVNKHLSLGGTIINFLNQTGAKGSIAGAELVEKENASDYNGAWMAGSYIRPFTVEFSASIKF
ncbi:MAG: TonB-dependent receptor, partial [Bacteroides sp.]|nr:TonB-dependent receptor [Bacteroides sp.]